MTARQELFTDISLVCDPGTHQWRPLYKVVTEKRLLPGRREPLEDLATVSGRENLGQAVIIRLLTPQGELGPLGHPEYGSRLHEVIGVPSVETTWNLIKLYILESLRGETRIDKIDQLTVEPVAGTRGLVRVRLRVTPVGQSQAMTIGPLTLEIGA